MRKKLKSYSPKKTPRAHVRIASTGLLGVLAMACSTPVNLQYAGAFDAPRPYDIAYSDGYAYVTSNTNGFMVVDVGIPQYPRVVSHITGTENPQLNRAVDLKVVGDYAYVGGGGGFVILDVEDPRNPRQVSFRPMTNIRGVQIVDDLAYVLSLNDGLYTYDISNPASPRLLSLLPYSSLSFVTQANTLVVAGDYAFLRSHPTGSASRGFEIVDIRNPSQPRVVGGMRTANHPTLLANEDTLFLGQVGYGRVDAYSLDDPANLELEGSFADESGVALEVPVLLELDDDSLYIWSKNNGSGDPAGISLLNVSDPSNMRHVVSLFDDSSMRLESARVTTLYEDKLFLAMYWDQEVEMIKMYDGSPRGTIGIRWEL